LRIGPWNCVHSKTWKVQFHQNNISSLKLLIEERANGTGYVGRDNFFNGKPKDMTTTTTIICKEVVKKQPPFTCHFLCP
jgi:hypothetical protein